MQGEMRCAGDRTASQGSLKLRACLETVHGDQTPTVAASVARKRAGSSSTIRQPDACGLWRDVR